MAIQALWTAVNSNIPVVYVICNNRSYRVLKLNMNTYRTQVLKEEIPSKYIAMDFPTPFNMAGIAEAMGMHGRKVERPEEVGPAMTEALSLGKPALLDMVIDGAV
jgi:benzoylformate decarboxylase